MRTLTIGSVLALAAVSLAMLMPDPAAFARTGAPARAASTSITVTGKEFSFTLSKKSIAKPGTVTFTFKNAGKMPHDFRIDGKQTPLTRPGKTAKLVVTFAKKGNYHYLCTVPGHAAAGMKGVFAVR
jgi:uncharacterized cupredoxin-like copper-binding protein